MFIEGNTIYSYGHHFPIAKRGDEKTVAFNESKYSQSTTRHQSLVKHALENHGFKLRKMNEVL